MISEVTVVTPSNPGRYPVVYHLHGYSQKAEEYLSHTDIVNDVDRLGLIAVLPQGGKSFYHDCFDKSQLWEQHLLHVIQYVDAHFQTRNHRSQRGIGGFSMGGYGAFALSLRRPWLCASVASLAGALDVRSLYQSLGDDSILKGHMRIAFGNSIPDESDLFWMIDAYGARSTYLIECGNSDSVICRTANARMSGYMQAKGLSCIYREVPGGHDWNICKQRMSKLMEFHADSISRE